LTNFASSGAIGTAAATVDVSSYVQINQTTNEINLTIPSPTNTTAGRNLIVTNIGTSTFTINTGNYVVPGFAREFIWNGSAWTPVIANPSALITDWSFKSTAAPSTSLYSWKGNRFTPDKDVLLYSMCFFGNSVANATYQAAVVTGSASPGNVATAIKSIPYTVGASPATTTGNYFWLDFAYPVLLSAGTIYGLMLGRTDSTDTYALPILSNGGVSAAQAVPMTGFSHGNLWLIASTSLAIGATIDTVSINSMSCGFRFKYPTSLF